MDIPSNCCLSGRKVDKGLALTYRKRSRLKRDITNIKENAFVGTKAQEVIQGSRNKSYELIFKSALGTI